MKKIKLIGKHGEGKFALVDNENYYFLNKWNWTAQFVKRNNNYYAIRHEGKRGERKCFMMHRVIMKLTNPKILVDHANGNGLDNRKNNLRKSTYSQNAINCGKPKLNKKQSSTYKGVCYIEIKNFNKNWNVRISVNGKRIYIDTYLTEVEAAKAYNKAAKKYHGEFAYLNKIVTNKNK